MNRKKLKKLYEEYDYESIYDKQIKNLEDYENLRLNSVYTSHYSWYNSLSEENGYCDTGIRGTREPVVFYERKQL